MGKIKVTGCDIEGLYVIEPTVFKDERGYFVETYKQTQPHQSILQIHAMRAVCFGVILRSELTGRFQRV